MSKPNKVHPTARPLTAAKAAELLARQKTDPSAAYAGFGGAQFSFGASLLSSDAKPDLGNGVDAELAQQLRKLSKKDALTRNKALGSIRALLGTLDESVVVAALPLWQLHYPRLVLDNNRQVRQQTAVTIGLFVSRCGRAIAPHLKVLLPPLYTSAQDGQKDVAAAAQAALQALLPREEKLLAALVMCRNEMFDYLQELLNSTPASLGDGSREGPDELTERHERAVCMALSTMVQLLIRLQDTQDTADGTVLRDRVQALAADSSFWRPHLTAKSSAIRQAAYTSMLSILQADPKAVPAGPPGVKGSLGALVMNATGDKEPAVQDALWAMCLSWAHLHTVAEVFDAGHTRKALLPRLHAALRSGGHGAAPTGVFPVILPLVSLMPKELLSTSDVCGLCLSTWLGRGTLPRTLVHCAVDTYCELLLWGLQRTLPLDTGLLKGPINELAIKLTSSGRAEQHDALEALAKLCNSLTQRDDIMRAIGEQVAEVVSSTLQQNSPSVCQGLIQLLQKFHGDDASHAAAFVGQTVTRQVDSHARAVLAFWQPIGMVLGGVANSEQTDAQVSKVLSQLVRDFGSSVLLSGTPAKTPEADARQDKGDVNPQQHPPSGTMHASPSLSIEALEAQLRSADGSTEHSAAVADLLLSCLAHRDDKAEAAVAILQRLLDSNADAALLMLHRLTDRQTHLGSLQGWRSQLLDDLALSSMPCAPASERSTPTTASLSATHRTDLVCTLVKGDGAISLLSASVVASVIRATAMALSANGAAQHTLIQGVGDVQRHGDRVVEGGVEGVEVAQGVQQTHVDAGGNEGNEGDREARGNRAHAAEDVCSDPSDTGRNDCSPDHHTHLGPSSVWALQVAGVTVQTNSLFQNAVTASALVDLIVALLRACWRGTAGRAAVLPEAAPDVQPEDDEGSDTPSSSDEDRSRDRTDGWTQPQQSMHSVWSSVIQNRHTVWHPAVLQQLQQQMRDTLSGLLRHDSGLAVQACGKLVMDVAQMAFPVPRNMMQPLFVRNIDSCPAYLAVAAYIASCNETATGGPAVLLAGDEYSTADIAQLTVQLLEQHDTAAAEAVAQWLVSGAGGSELFNALLRELLPQQVSDAASGLANKHNALVRLVVAARDAAVDGSKPQQALFLSTCRHLLSDAVPVSLKMKLLPLVAGTVRAQGRQWVQESGLGPRALLTLRDLKQLPPVASVDNAQQSNQAQQVIDHMRLACACYPVPSDVRNASTYDVGWTSSAEKDLLLEQTMRQIAGFRAARRAAMFEHHLRTNGAASVAAARCEAARSGLAEVKQMVGNADAGTAPAHAIANNGIGLTELGQMIASTVIHARARMETDDWSIIFQMVQQHLTVCQHVRERCQDVLVLMHTARSKCSGSTTAELDTTPSHAPSVTPQMAVESASALAILHKRGLLQRLPQAYVPFQQAVALSHAPAEWFAGPGQAMLQAAALCAVISCSETTSAPPIPLENNTYSACVAAAECRAERQNESEGGPLLTEVVEEDAASAESEYETGDEGDDDGAAMASAWETVEVDVALSALRTMLSIGTVCHALGVVDEQLAGQLQEKLPTEPCRALAALLLKAAPKRWPELQALLAEYDKEVPTDVLQDAEEEPASAPRNLSASVLVSLLLPMGRHVELDPCSTPGHPPSCDATPHGYEATPFADAALDTLTRAPIVRHLAHVEERDLELQPDDTDVYNLDLPVALSLAMEQPESRGPYLAAWGFLLLQLLSLEGTNAVRLQMAQALRERNRCVPELLDVLLQLVPLHPTRKALVGQTQGWTNRRPAQPTSLAAQLSRAGVPANQDACRRLAVPLYRAVLQALPGSARSWFAELRDRGTAIAVEKYTTLAHSADIIREELAATAATASSSEQLSSEQFHVRANLNTREVLSVLTIEDGATLEMAIKLPTVYPLKPPEVELRRKVGIADGRLRKWLLSISAFLRNNNGPITDAIVTWKSNLDKEFEGVEECLICFSIVLPGASGRLPELKCNTCRKRFHALCLYKWFKSSGKDTCVHCGEPW